MIFTLNDMYLVKNVRPLKLFEDANLLDAVALRVSDESSTNTGSPCSIRGKIVIDADVVTLFALNHPSSATVEESQKITLSQPCYINYVEFSCSKSKSVFSYNIKVSNNGANWRNLIDYRNFRCRGKQKLWIKPSVVRFIDINATDWDNGELLKISPKLLITYSVRRCNFEIQNDMLVPKENVAIKHRAIVLSGVSRDPDSLINGDYTNYDWDFGYTCHQLGNGDITLQLYQPYIIGSFRMLLWDVEKRYYSYYIQTSVDGENWDIVVDKREEACISWQNLTFDPRPIVFIKIIGTHNTANEVFHCVHFECPSSLEE